MKEKTLEIRSVLSDPTRYNIYEYIIEAEETVTVKDVAKLINIHSNVARYHLTKLVELELIKSYINQKRSNRNLKRLYLTNELGNELSVLYSDYKLLSSITIQEINKLSNAANSIIYNVGKE